MSAFNDPRPDECECCQFETEHLTKTDAYARTRGHGPFTNDEDKEWAWLCEVCRSTPTGNAYLYPTLYSLDLLETLVTIAWGINEIKRTISLDIRSDSE